jgi:hypothetical protein
MPNPENIERYKMKKGTTLNPKGRPKGARNRSTLAREWLEVSEKVKNPITGVIEQLEQQDIMTLALIKEARKGNVQAYKELMDSAYGKVTQPTDITTQGDKLGVSTEELRLLWKESLKHGHE